MKRVTFGIIVFLFTQSGCMRDCGHTIIPNSSKPYMFKEGSYWVYDNTSTGLTDTLTVIKAETKILTGGSPTRNCKGNPTTEMWLITVTYGGDTFSVYTGEALYLSSDFSFKYRSYVFDPSLNNGECSKYDGGLCAGNVTSLTLGANVFDSVYPVITTFNSALTSQSLFSAQLYWVKNIGLIKAVCQDSANTTLNLQSWHVVQ